jgi:predicted dehydrogenase
MNRRNFIQGAAVAAPLILSSRVWSADAAPSKKVTMGFIGMGKQSGGLLGGFMGRKDVQVLAVCDVDTTRREAAQARVKEHYSKGAAGGEFKGIEAYNDYKELLARKDIDAVCIATPDHWHAIITVAALKAGKDVYCEKPLTHNVEEALKVIAAVQETGRVLQTGSMQRSMGEFRVAAEVVRNGLIGKVSHIHTQFSGPPRPMDYPEEEMEKGLDWDKWVGPSSMVKYNSVLAPRGVHNHFPNWREVSEFGGGYVTDWGAHHVDIAHWALDMDASGPVKITCPAGAAQAFAAKKNKQLDGAVLEYANGVTITHKGDGYGVHIFGDKGEMKVNRGKFELILDGKVFAKKSDGEDKVSVESQYNKVAKELLTDAKVQLYKSNNQLEDFIKCIESRKKPICHEGVGGHTAIACHLMNIAYRTGKNFGWDPLKNVLTDGGVPVSELSRQYRAGYTVG